MQKILMQSILFKGMSEDEIDDFIRSFGAYTERYDKNEIIFDVEDKPQYMYLLLRGAIAVCKDSYSGKKTVLTTIEDAGNIFAEVYLFLEKESYDFYTTAIVNDTEVLKIPRAVFTEGDRRHHYPKLIGNMLSILSQKAFNLNQTLKILGSGGLRQKLAALLLDMLDENNCARLTMNREQIADYLQVARPSLSRELIRMQDEGLIEVRGRTIRVPCPETLALEL